MGYYVNSYYNYAPDEQGNITDYVCIGVATKEDEEHDGENWDGHYDGFRFNIYDSLEQAIRNAGFIANKITFEHLSKEEHTIAQNIVGQLMADNDYLKEFGQQNMEQPI